MINLTKDMINLTKNMIHLTKVMINFKFNERYDKDLINLTNKGHTKEGGTQRRHEPLEHSTTICNSHLINNVNESKK